MAVHAIAPNLLDRQFDATGPNQKWAADFTYVWIPKKIASFHLFILSIDTVG
jgi:transposase InsO family protein